MPERVKPFEVDLPQERMADSLESNDRQEKPQIRLYDPDRDLPNQAESVDAILKLLTGNPSSIDLERQDDRDVLLLLIDHMNKVKPMGDAPHDEQIRKWSEIFTRLLVAIFHHESPESAIFVFDAGKGEREQNFYQAVVPSFLEVHTYLFEGVNVPITTISCVLAYVKLLPFWSARRRDHYNLYHLVDISLSTYVGHMRRIYSAPERDESFSESDEWIRRTNQAIFDLAEALNEWPSVNPANMVEYLGTQVTYPDDAEDPGGEILLGDIFFDLLEMIRTWRRLYKHDDQVTTVGS